MLCCLLEWRKLWTDVCAGCIRYISLAHVPFHAAGSIGGEKKKTVAHWIFPLTIWRKRVNERCDLQRHLLKLARVETIIQSDLYNTASNRALPWKQANNKYITLLGILLGYLLPQDISAHYWRFWVLSQICPLQHTCRQQTCELRDNANWQKKI